MHNNRKLYHQVINLFTEMKSKKISSTLVVNEALKVWDKFYQTMNKTILEKVLDLSSHSSNTNPEDASSAGFQGNIN